MVVYLFLCVWSCVEDSVVQQGCFQEKKESRQAGGAEKQSYVCCTVLSMLDRHKLCYGTQEGKPLFKQVRINKAKCLECKNTLRGRIKSRQWLCPKRLGCQRTEWEHSREILHKKEIQRECLKIFRQLVNVPRRIFNLLVALRGANI